MEKKIMTWKTKGMNRDLSVSAFNPEFSFENYNLRLSTNEGNTTLSWVNEKGTKQITLRIRRPYVPGKEGQIHIESMIYGIPIGTAVINHKLVLFTTVPPTKDNEHGKDIIYVLSFNPHKTALIGMVLFQGWLNFDVNYPLETFVSYEAEHIQKVYWTDGLNQPRVINIAAPESHIWRWHYLSDEVDRKEYNYKDSKQPDTFFDFVPSFYTDESVEIRKNNTGGLFQPGVIQYCFTYYNKYGQQSNVVYVSPLYYLSSYGKGESPEKTVPNSFRITIENTDRFNFDYVRLYSVQRIAVDSTPIVRRVADLPIPKTFDEEGITNSINFVDNGIVGNTIDATELLYIGGKEISVLTMTEKDDTLFMGNIVEKSALVNKLQDYFYSKWEKRLLDNKDQTDLIQFGYSCDNVYPKTLTQPKASGFYSYAEMLDNDASQLSTFKGGEYYRFGIQLQKYTGEWTEPIFIGDKMNDMYPHTRLHGDKILLSFAKFGYPIYETTEDENVKLIGYGNGIDWSVFSNEEIDGSPNPYYIEDFYLKYRSVRPLIVYPNLYDRRIVCQGVLNPTVFNAQDRISNSPYAQPSWYFRPYTWNDDESSSSGGTVVSDQSYFNDKLKQSRLLYGELPHWCLDKIRERGYMILSQSYDEDTQWYPDAFLIFDNTDPLRYRVAFVFSNSPYPTLVQGNLSYTGVTYRVFPQSDTHGTDANYHDYEMSASSFYAGYTTPVGIYKELFLKTDWTYSYKIMETGAPTEYVLTVRNPWNSGANKVFTFENDGASDSQAVYYTKGSTLEFRHYRSIRSADNADAQSAEIEGSKDKYLSVAMGDEVSDVSSNTQFFVDQSIETLNSPDIEYDGEIKNYSSEELYLDIVGIIPITSSASSHIIDAGSMMETGSGTSDVEHRLCSGELNGNVYHENLSTLGDHRLVADYLWNDISVWYDNDDVKSGLWEDRDDYLVYPWQSEGSLTADARPTSTASSVLRTKKESNTLFSAATLYAGVGSLRQYKEPIPSEEGGTYYPEYWSAEESFIDQLGSVSMSIHHRENTGVYNKRLVRKYYSDLSYTEESDRKLLNYYPNIDKVLFNQDGFKKKNRYGHGSGSFSKLYNPVKMKYSSNSHAVLTFHSNNGEISIPGTARAFGDLLTIGEGAACNSSVNTFWGAKERFHQRSAATDLSNYIGGSHYPFLWLGELVKEDVVNRFGGSSMEAIRSNTWYVAGESTPIKEGSLSPVSWLYGDTYFQRYDCLKTYCLTEEDSNQIVEILSFMCETRVNLDGRYDSNRGQWKNYNAVPENYVKLNDVYSQQDNFFTYKQTDNSDLKGEDARYPNHITYSKTKETGEDVDTYANVTLASVLELDGDKGKIRSIRKFNDNLIVFQDSAISQIQYNENVQIASTAGVPIEIANSGKVRGYRYLSDSIGCDNKWSIVNTPLGLYFMSSLNKGIYRIGNQLESLSQQKGFNVWCSNNIPEISKEDTTWTPVNMSYFVGYYDRQNQEVLFINKDWCLAYNEAVGEFTSFYDYNNVPFFCNLDNTGLWINWADLKQVDPEDPQSYIHNYESRIHEHRGGNDYCNFFGEYKGYGMTLVANAEPQRDKIFTNMEFRATVEGEGEPDAATGKYEPYLPFNHIHTWNEYQEGNADLKHFKGIPSMRHPSVRPDPDKDIATATALKRKFRIWRCDIPRDSQHKMDRMRNPWQYIKLWHKSGFEWDKSNGKKVEIHDVQAVYFV